MSEPYVPDGFTRVTPYLTVNGAQKLLDFLVAVFDARVVDRAEQPDGKLARAAVRIGDSTIELSEAAGKWGPMPGAIHIYVPDVTKLIDGHCNMAPNRCTSRWRWITPNARLPCGTHLETTGISPPIIESERMKSGRTLNARLIEGVARESV